MLFSITSYAQIGGNQVYQNAGSSNTLPTPVSRTNIYSTDSTLYISASILLNKEADYYLMTISVTEAQETVLACNQNLKVRINTFIADLKTLDIKDDQIYVDYISQTKIYDHSVEGNIITEYLNGFEIRKNILIKLRNLEAIDNIIDLASKQEIYDIVQVEYYNEDIEKIYDQLFDEVIEIIEKRKSRFSKHSSIPISNRFRLVQDDFSIYNPKDMYKQYNEAFETSIVNTHYSGNYVKKSVRKDRTFYYESVQNSLNVDKIIDNISPLVGIQYVLRLNIIYDLDR